MLKKIINKFWFNDDDTKLQISENEEVELLLKYKNIVIGTLSYKDNCWEFTYSEEFKFQTTISPLINFPQKEKTYQSKELWPFFASRIPGSAQLMESKNDKTTDVVELLKGYGHRTITNPFELVTM